MRGAWLACGLALSACTSVPNPNHCEGDGDCRIGSICDLETHGCVLSIDAAPIDEIEIDAPFVPRTIREVRAEMLPLDTPVDLQDVIVVAIDRYGGRVGEVWLQDEGGGPMSGIRAFGAVTADVDALSVGDRVDVIGARKIAFAPADDVSGRHEIELAPTAGGILHLSKKVGSAAPVAMQVDLVALGQVPAAQLDAERDKLVGTLIRVDDVKALTDADRSSGDPTQLLFSIGVLDVEAQIAPFPSPVMQNHCFESITGVLEYFRSYRLLPTTTADVDDIGCL